MLTNASKKFLEKDKFLIYKGNCFMLQLFRRIKNRKEETMAENKNQEELASRKSWSAPRITNVTDISVTEGGLNNPSSDGLAGDFIS
jgi:hypothetical protein